MLGQLNSQLTMGSTLAEVIVTAIARYPDRVAFCSDEATITYKQLGERISRVAHYFDSVGLRAGDVVAQLAGNKYEVFATIAAVYLRGMRSVTLHTLGSLDDHAFMLDDSGARIVIADAAYSERAQDLKQRCATVQQWLSLGDIFEFSCLDQAIAPFEPTVLKPVGSAEDIIRIAYTGGTTGRSKGVLLSNRALLMNTLLSSACKDWPQHTRYLCVAPISHGAGSLVIPTLMRGGSVTLLPQFSPDAVIEAIQRYKCNVTWMVPTMLYALLDAEQTKTVDWSQFHSLIYSAAPIAPTRLRQALDMFGPILSQSYGQTEAPNTILFLGREDHKQLRDEQLGATGRPYPFIEVRLLDEQGQIVKAGEVGEICVRGPLVMSGYLHLPEETAKAFSGDWLHTGDMAYQDAEGLFYIVDRKKDLIISGGFNVYPKEVEDALCGHDAVAAAAVVGVPDAKWGEMVVAYVQIKDLESFDEEALIAFVRKAKGAVAAPKRIVCLTKLPVTALGKIDKKALRVKQLL